MLILAESGSFENRAAAKTYIYTLVASTTAWIKIWFLARCLDPQGSGHIKVPLSEVCSLVGREASTVYEWLRKAEAARVVRTWTIKKGVLSLYYSSLLKVCSALEINDLGAVAEVSIEDIKNLRSVACQVETQQLQEKSRFAARKSLGKEAKRYKLNSIEELIGQPGASGESQSYFTAAVPSIIHRGERRVFVSEAFIPFGASQQAIAEHLGCSDRTVRRYLSKIPKKQILQTKPEYQFISEGLNFGLDCVAGSSDTYVSTNKSGNLRLFENYGKSKAMRPGGHPIQPERFTKYFGRFWLYRCNVYGLNHELRSKKLVRNQLKKLMLEKQPPTEGLDGKKLIKEQECGKRKGLAGNVGQNP